MFRNGIGVDILSDLFHAMNTSTLRNKNIQACQLLLLANPAMLQTLKWMMTWISQRRDLKNRQTLTLICFRSIAHHQILMMSLSTSRLRCTRPRCRGSQGDVRCDSVNRQHGWSLENGSPSETNALDYENSDQNSRGKYSEDSDAEFLNCKYLLILNMW